MRLREPTNLTVGASELRHLADHPGDYVRLLSINPKAKQRHLEQVIQKPV